MVTQAMAYVAGSTVANRFA